MPRQRKVTLTIPKPCHEDWENMTPIARGRYCASCEKLVTDFSQQSPEEIAAYLARHPKENLCGRFTSAQLGVPYTLHPERRPAAWPKWLVAAGLASASFNLLSAQNGFSESTIVSSGVQNPPLKIGAGQFLEFLVKDDYGDPIEHASISIYSEPSSTIVSKGLTDSLGMLRLSLFESVDSFTVSVSALGFENKTIKISDLANGLQQPYQMSLTWDSSYLIMGYQPTTQRLLVGGAVCVVGNIIEPEGFNVEPEKNFWYYVKWPFKQVGRVFKKRD